MGRAPTQDFVKQQGLSYLAHLLRRISDELVEGVENWSAGSGLRSPARTRSTLMALSTHGIDLPNASGRDKLDSPSERGRLGGAKTRRQ